MKRQSDWFAQRNRSQSGLGSWRSLKRSASLAAQGASAPRLKAGRCNPSPAALWQRADALKRQTKLPDASCCPLPPPHPHCHSIYSNTTYIFIGFHTSSLVFLPSGYRSRIQSRLTKGNVATVLGQRSFVSKTASSSPPSSFTSVHQTLRRLVQSRQSSSAPSEQARHMRECYTRWDGGRLR